MYVPLSPLSAAHARVGAQPALQHGKSTSDHIPQTFSPIGHSWQQLLSWGGAGTAPPPSLLEFWLLELSWTSSHRRRELMSTAAVSCPENGIPHRGRHPTALLPVLQL